MNRRRDRGYPGTPFLDRFLGILKQTSVSRSTARTLFGLAGTEELSAYDGLFYELEDDRLAEFRSLISRSHEGTAGPGRAPGQSVYGYVGKRVGIGALGITKQVSLTVASLADAAAWANWRAAGKHGDPPALSKDVADGFDYIANWVANSAKAGATPAELERDKRDLVESYGVGDVDGQVVGILFSTGLGGGRAGVKAVAQIAQFAQGGQAVEDAWTKASDRIDQIRKQRPDATWSELVADHRVQVQLGNGVAALIGMVGLAGGETAVGKLLKRFPLIADTAVLLPMLKQASIDYSDPGAGG